MGAALVAVGVGSAGAAVLAMSLLASDLPNPVPEQDIIASAVATDPAPSVEEPIFKDLIPETGAAPAATAAIAALPAPQKTAPQKTAAEEAADLAALGPGDPRFAHDASAARGIVDLEPDDDASLPENAFGPMRKTIKIPFDQVDTERAGSKATAAVTLPPAPDVSAAKELPGVESSGRAASGNALMIDDANIRARPQKGAKVIGTVPARTEVQLVGCEAWCEIIVEGKRGYVWGEFVRRGGKTKFTVSKASENDDDGGKPKVMPASGATLETDPSRTR
jgi:hypothetical protein